MSFETFADFLHMGGHALYVWMSFGVTAVAIAINLVHLSRLRSQALDAVAQDALLHEKSTDDARTETGMDELSEKQL